MQILGATPEHLLDIVTRTTQGPKKRFELINDVGPVEVQRARAAQGHGGRAAAQTDNALMMEEFTPVHSQWTEVGIHGTKRNFVYSILKKGLLPGGERGQEKRKDVHMVAAINETAETSGVRGGSDVFIKVRLRPLVEAPSSTALRRV